jgi:ribonucleoside-diphosphate reductase beta chain
VTDVLNQRAPIRSTTGLDRDSVPWRLWEKAKESFWDPKDIDFSKDAADFASFTEEQKVRVIGSARGFMVGEEAVTIDILPVIRAISREGRLEETIYLTSFALEEAKHVDFFRLFFDSIGIAEVPQMQGGQGNGNGNGQGRGQAGGLLNNLFTGGLGEIMGRLDTDTSPEAFLDAALMYNQFVEGVLALAGYRGWKRLFESLGGDVLPGFQEGLALVQKDERRHIAYGTYLIRRIVAEHPESWAFVERRWEEITGPITTMVELMKERIANGETSGPRGAYGTIDMDFVVKQCKRRLDMLRVSTDTTADDVEHATIESFEPTEMAEITS